MKYHSTRNPKVLIESAEAVLQGLAPDGGLYVPEFLPQIDFKRWQNYSYQRIAKEIFTLFFSDFDELTIDQIVQSSYGNNFDTAEITPSYWLNNKIGFLELWHGPTLAFKDLALQFLPHLMRAAQKKVALKQKVLILTATSGDTGKAAMEGFAGVDGFRVIVFYPYAGVSSFQKRQMLTREHDNVRAIALKGDFDACQRGVKKLFTDQSFIKEIQSHGYVLSSANSINIGRLIPQTIYYIYSYLQAVKEGRLKFGEPLSIVVPTGNFGNILAASYAKEMGLPLGQIHLAANQNNVLSQFLESGIYNANRNLIKTSSPSMDILVASNLERYLYLKNPDSNWIVSLMNHLNSEGEFTIDKNLLDISASWADEDETSQAIQEVFVDYKYLLDPHTAVAYAGAKKVNLSSPVLIASTASPYKFMNKIFDSLDQKNFLDDWQAIEKISKLTDQEIPQSIRKMWSLKQDQESAVEIEDMASIISSNV
ncbi:MAG TPA: threonine synthase [Candidatus Eisenbacteria bacterium]|nr:threonine synthase [Candidatus Eisenbacteria bacterium]